MIGRIRWEELVNLLGCERLEQNGTLDLFIHVAAQIPSHGFAPSETVDRSPRRDLVIGAEQFQHGIFETERGAIVIFEIRVDAIGIGIEDGF